MCVYPSFGPMMILKGLTWRLLYALYYNCAYRKCTVGVVGNLSEEILYSIWNIWGFLWSHISLVYRPVEVLFVLSFPAFEGLHADIICRYIMLTTKHSIIRSHNVSHKASTHHIDQLRLSIHHHRWPLKVDCLVYQLTWKCL